MGLSYALIGAKGRMGAAIAAAATAAGDHVTYPLDQGDDLAAGIAAADAVIDFSFHTVTAGVIAAAARHAKPLVIGTTGHAPDEKARLLAAAAAAAVPCVWAGNFSVGVNLLFALTRRATAVLGADYDTEVIEMHHRMKKDAPSGTAERLLEIILEERHLTRDALTHGRSGIPGERPIGEIGVHALRGGDVVGDHTVLYAGIGERIELTHKASDRAVFARGAIRAAHWAREKPAGIYDMQDVLGLR